ncbi:MAG TPA: triple tyrosine motif-containing protein, partial [Chitinophagaceae bacterium]|nr:triple tyrosine motif-containing protein [Chitinophagaceae bacterium]
VIASPFTALDATRQRLHFAEKIIPLTDGRVLLCLYDGWYVCSPGGARIERLEASTLNQRLSFIQRLFSGFTTDKEEPYFQASHLFKLFDRFFVCIHPRADSLLLLDENGRQLGRYFFPYNRYPHVSWSQQMVALDSSKLLFLFHNYGLLVIPVSWQKGEPQLHTAPAPLFSTTEYGNALCDRQGNWWLATTENGLEKIAPHKQSFKGAALIDSSSGMPGAAEVITIAHSNHTLWLATYGDGFFKIDLPTGRQQQYRLHNTGNDTWANFVWNTRQAAPDTLWVGTQAGMFWYCLSNRRYGRIAALPGKPAALDSVAITTQFTDSRGLVWMGLGKGRGLCCFDPVHRRFRYYPGSNPEGYPLRYPINITEDKKGDLWFTSDASTMLICWHRHTDSFQSMALPVDQRKQLSNLFGIYCESDSVLWLGTIASGLVRFSITGNTATIYGHDKGLVNSHINSIHADGAGRLWLVTDGGLSCFDPVAETFSNYSENEGLPLRSPTAFFCYDPLEKQLYGGGHGAYFYFDPDKMYSSRSPQKTVITAVQVNGRPFMVRPGEPIAFGVQENDITIHYAAIDLARGPETKYAYKLVGEDTGWTMAGQQRQINFSHLSPGHYTFMVRSANGGGGWNPQVASLRFYIHPPFTQTPLFYALVLLAISALFYFLYHFRLRQMLRTEQIRAEISRNLHDEVGSTLTNISLGSLLAQKQLHKGPANGTMDRLLDRIYQDSQTVSQTMREIVWSINPKIDTLGEALPCMLQYASELLEAKNIELQAEIAPGIEHIKLNMQRRRDLYLIFKEAVNNLARHSNAQHATVCFRVSGNTIVMTVWDDGTGFAKTVSLMGNGLKNMRQRAESHRWQLNIQSEPGTGTTLILKAAIA